MIDEIWKRIVVEIVECVYHQFPKNFMEYEDISFWICIEIYKKELKQKRKKMLKRFDEIHNSYMMNPFGTPGVKNGS